MYGITNAIESLFRRHKSTPTTLSLPLFRREEKKNKINESTEKNNQKLVRKFGENIEINLKCDSKKKLSSQIQMVEYYSMELRKFKLRH